MAANDLKGEAPPPAPLKEKLKETLAELEGESFKNAVLQELKEASRRKSTFQHPAFLLFLGFLLTGVVGTWLTSYWQARAKENERAQLAHERAIQQKYDVADQINKAVSEAYAGAQVMIGVAASGLAGADEKELAEQEAYWKQAARTSAINSWVLRQKLAVNFKNKEANDLYGEIIVETEDLNIIVREGVRAVRKNKGKPLGEQDIKELLIMAESIRQKTQRLLEIMMEETQRLEGVEPSPSPQPNPPAPAGTPAAAPTSK